MAGTFEEFMAKVDTVCTARLGLSIHDLADMPFYDFFVDGITPKQVVRLALQENGG